ncbi:MAG: hypothetical protein ABJC63_01595 [Gemmatimonadales bacterium]
MSVDALRSLDVIAGKPVLGILLVTDSYEAIVTVLGHYRAQGNPARLEIVIIGLNGIEMPAAAFERWSFPHLRILPSDSGDIGEAEGMAVREATAPFVVFAQAGSYPKPGFVDAILRALESSQWAVVGPSIESANPGTTLSWAALWILYGPWVDARARGGTVSVPGHNSAYNRRALLSLGDDLERFLDAGSQLQVELSARGNRCILEPEARIEIVMPTRPGEFIGRLFQRGRQFAGQRSAFWSLARRLVYVAASPIIPLVRLRRIVALVVQRGQGPAALPGFPALLLGLAASATGEMFGYLFGVALSGCDQST